MKEHLDLVLDEGELRNYYENIYPDLLPCEVIFVSLSARNKYLSESEREALNLGRTEMFERRIVRKKNWEKFIRTIYKFESNLRAYTTKNNSTIPPKCMVCYININPSNVLKAYKEFSNIMNEYMMEAMIKSEKNQDMENIYYRITKMDRLLLDQLQKSTGTRHWVDIDFDVPDDSLVDEFIVNMQQEGVKYEVIQTYSGWHVMLRKDTLKFNYKEVVDGLSKRAGVLKGMNGRNQEIVVNENAMIPLPGTSQAGSPVRIVTYKYS